MKEWVRVAKWVDLILFFNHKLMELNYILLIYHKLRI